MKSNPFGYKGDFITAPIFQYFFGNVVNLDCFILAKFKISKKINLIELGSGNGQMIYDMINSFKIFPNFINPANS